MALTIKVNDVLFAIPFRHHIPHPYAFLTLGECGIDYTKAVVLADSAYIGSETPRIDSKEWNIVKRNENTIRREFEQYLKQYKKALKNRTIPRNARFLKYSTLQYFEEFL